MASDKPTYFDIFLLIADYAYQKACYVTFTRSIGFPKSDPVSVVCHS
jgi:hypothetical protein